MYAITVEEIVARLRTLRRGKLFIATFINECNVQDMIPVVHGRWVSYPHQIDRECSICGHTEPYKFADKDAEIFNFCPHCGADMRKEQE